MSRLDALDARLPRRLRRPEYVAVAAALVFLGAALTFKARYEVFPGPLQAVVEIDAPGAAGDDVTVGPTPTDDLDAYAAARHSELDALAAAAPDEQRVAVVVLDRFEEAAAALQIVGTAEIVGVRLRAGLAGEEPDSPLARPSRRTAPNGLPEVLDEEAAALRRSAAELEEMAATTDLEDFAAQFRADRDELLELAAALDERRCPCVYAVEVRAPLALLAERARAPGVRYIDVAPAGLDADQVSFRVPLPLR